MLKSIFNGKKETKDKIPNSIADGYVDIKVYKGEAKPENLIYHDTGDNVVTQWSRNALITLFAGYGFFDDGIAPDSSSETKGVYIPNGGQFNGTIDTAYPIKSNKDKFTFPVFPTKVLFGTGKEYSSYADIIKVSDETWKKNVITNYGGESSAESNITNLINNAKNTYKKTITLNDPDTSSILNTPTGFSKYTQLDGAIRTIAETADSPSYDTRFNYNAVGYPCYIYFNRNGETEETTGEVKLRKANETDYYYTMVDFQITLASQTGKTYNPYNGYLLKQIGLFNDAFLPLPTGIANSMEQGTLLAIKNIEAFTKTPDETVVVTWTLNI